MAASFQAAVVDVLVSKTRSAVEEYNVTAVHLVGGVSANKNLREVMVKRIEVPVRAAPAVLCTDNAAMIAAAAHWHIVSGRRDSLDFDVLPGLQLR